jgi:hypothetical protein
VIDFDKLNFKIINYIIVKINVLIFKNINTSDN